MFYGRLFTRFAVIAGTILATLAVAVRLSSPASNVVAAVFPPWWSAEHSFAAAASAGELLGTGHVSSVLVVRGEPAVLAARLYGAGALFLLDSGAFGGCLTRSQETVR